MTAAASLIADRAPVVPVETERGNTAIACVFLPRHEADAACARRLLTTSFAAHGLIVQKWSDRPDHVHVFIEQYAEMTVAEFRQRLAQARKETDTRAAAYRLEHFRITSLCPSRLATAS